MLLNPVSSNFQNRLCANNSGKTGKDKFLCFTRSLSFLRGRPPAGIYLVILRLVYIFPSIWWIGSTPPIVGRVVILQHFSGSRTSPITYWGSMDVIHPLPMDTIAHKANRAGTTVRRISRLGAGLLFDYCIANFNPGLLDIPLFFLSRNTSRLSVISWCRGQKDVFDFEMLACTKMVRDAASNTSQSRRKLDQILCTMHNHLLHNALLTPASWD